MIQKDRYFYKTFISLLGVTAFQSLIVYSVNLADSIMLGSYNELQMSGVSLANQIQFLLQMLVGGVANGMVVLSSQYWGKRSMAPIKRVFSAALWVGVILGGIVSAAVLIFPQGVLGLLSNEPEIVNAGAEYIRIMGFTYIIFAVSNILTALMRSIESVKIGFFTAMLALTVNIFLNYGLIFGHFGMPELGSKGAAYATFASRAAEFAALMIYVFFIDKKLKLKVKDIFIIEKDYFSDFIRAGLPLVGSGGSWGVAMTVQTAIIGRLGPACIGANAISAPVFQVVSVLYSSSSVASSVLIGKTVGENDIPRVKKYTKKLQFIYVIFGLISSLTLFISKNIILSFYDVTADTRELAEKFIIILAITVIGSAYEAPCLTGIVSGGGDTKFVLINDLIFMWGLVLPWSALSAFVFKWSIPVTFFILKADQLAKCFVAMVKVNRYKWIKNLTRN